VTAAPDLPGAREAGASRPPVAVALDALDVPTALRWTTVVGPHVAAVKVGLELFCRFGPAMVTEIRGRTDADLFLDLKLHDRRAGCGSNPPQQREDGGFLVAADLGGRLVGEQQRRRAGESDGHPGPGALATGERVRQRVPYGGEPEPVDQLVSRGSVVAAQRAGEHDVLAHVEVTQQAAALGQHADVPSAQPRRMGGRAVAQPLARDLDRSAVRVVEPGEQPQQGRLA